MDERILLFIPCYNCADQIGRVVGQLQGTVVERIAQVLVLDNCSRDDTIARACAAARSVVVPLITIGRNHDNYHLGGSHKVAFGYAAANGFTHVLVLHGDDQGRLDDVASLLERGEHLLHDACLGSRFMASSYLRGYSSIRRFGNLAFNLLFSAVTRRRISDLGSGLNIFGRTVFSDPAVMKASDDLRFNIYLLLGMIDRGQRLRYFPISWREEDQLSNVRLVSQSLRTLEIAWEYLGRRRHFRATDHRDRVVADYGFDIVFQANSND